MSSSYDITFFIVYGVYKDGERINITCIIALTQAFT